jgi:hypothetical protein
VKRDVTCTGGVPDEIGCFVNAGFSTDTRTVEFNRFDADIQGPSGLFHGTPVTPEDQHLHLSWCQFRGRDCGVVVYHVAPKKVAFFAPTFHMLTDNNKN